MSTWVKKLSLSLVSSTLAGSLLFSPSILQRAHAKSSPHATVKQVQLICDQDSVGAGGRISYHILYHDVENKNGSHIWLKIKIPNGFDMDDSTLKAVEWDAANRILKWDLKAKGSGIIHFNLQAKKDAPDHTTCNLSAYLEENGEVLYSTPEVKVYVGKEAHDPFFFGYPDGDFHPAASITRAEVAAVVARIKHLPAEPFEEYYLDVPHNYWAFNVISEVTKAGYMNGFDGKFNPDAPISRAELVTLLLRIRGIDPIPLPYFSDAKNHWAKDDIATAKALNYISGVDADRFNPEGYTEREVAAKLFDIAIFRGPLVNGETADVQHYPDVNRTRWSFPWVEEASTVPHESLRKENGESLIRYLTD